MNKQIYLIAIALATLMVAMPQVQAQTISVTTTNEEHHFHPDHWAWRQGLQNPYGVFQGNNVVVVPATTLSQSVVNTCPTTSPVLLSTGQCITTAQALYEIQTGQIQVGGTVQAQGQVIVGNPVVLGAQGYTNPFDFVGHFHHHFHDNDETTVTTTTP